MQNNLLELSTQSFILRVQKLFMNQNCTSFLKLLGLIIYLLIFNTGIGQHPGGVSGARAWYISSWNGRFLVDTSGYNLKAYNVPPSATRSFNFHTAVRVPHTCSLVE